MEGRDNLKASSKTIEVELPWPVACLEEICAISSGITKGRKPPNEPLFEVSYMAVANVQDGRLNLDLVKKIQASASEIERYRLLRGDLLLTEGGDPDKLGRGTTWNDEIIPCIHQNHIFRVRVNSPLVDMSFLSRLVASPVGKAYFLSKAKQTTGIASINLTQLRSFPVPLPPLNEQRRIAAKLDTTLAAVEACRQRLDGVATILKRFRQAVLAAATSGELTREWREERGAGDWTVEKAADVCAKVQSGGTPKEGFIDEPGVPFLKVYNLVHQEVDFGYRPQYVRPEAHLGPLGKSRVMPGDVLMNNVGPPLGKVAIVPDDYDEWNINQAITLFRPSKRITGAWLYILLYEGASIREIQLQTKGSAGQVNISLTQCREFTFPVPSTDEQDEIADRVEALFLLAHELEVKLTTARKIIDRLTPALLAKAFRGELVPQDPNDEPASVLLERIRAARQVEAAAGKPSRRGRRKAAAGPEQAPLPAAQAPPDLLAQLLQECGALSERALLAASELDPAGFRAQLAFEQGMGVIRETAQDGQVLLEAVG
jgi:type I restriction enzyme S subunit